MDDPKSEGLPGAPPSLAALALQVCELCSACAPIAVHRSVRHGTSDWCIIRALLPTTPLAPPPLAARHPHPHQAAVAHDFWRVQRRQLACLPDHLANELLRHLLEQRRVLPPQLELFRRCVTAVTLTGGPDVRGATLSYVGAFEALAELRLQRCTKLRDGHLQHLAPLAPTLSLLDLGGCAGLSDCAADTLLLLTQLRSLNLSGTGLHAPALTQLSCLAQLTSLDLAELPADDATCAALAGSLRQLQHLRLSGCHAVTDAGVGYLEQLAALTSLDLSYTRARAPPVAPTLRRLVMAHCTLALAPGSPQEAVWLQFG